MRENGEKRVKENGDGALGCLASLGILGELGVWLLMGRGRVERKRGIVEKGKKKGILGFCRESFRNFAHKA